MVAAHALAPACLDADVPFFSIHLVFCFVFWLGREDTVQAPGLDRSSCVSREEEPLASGGLIGVYQHYFDIGMSIKFSLIHPFAYKILLKK
jgi:hypothetical protein